MTTAKIWATVKYFYPDPVKAGISWDKAVIAALPAIRKGGSTQDFQIALSSLLSTLGDPQTFLLDEKDEPDNWSISIERTAGNVLLVTEKPGGPSLARAQLLEAVQSSPDIIFDLRGSPSATCRLAALLDEPEFARQLTRVALSTSELRSRIHNGWVAENATGLSNFHAAFYTRTGLQISGDPQASQHRLVFLMNEHGALPVVATALWENGRASVLADSTHFRCAYIPSAILPLGDGKAAYLRLADSRIQFSPLAVASTEAIAKATALLQQPELKPSERVSTPDLPSPAVSQTFDSSSSYPEEGDRILAAFKAWSVVHYFFAYRDQMDEDWDEQLAAFLPKFLQAKDAREYHLTVADMITHLADSQAVVASKELAEYIGVSPVGLRMRLIEKRPMITEILDPESRAAGVQVGDIVARVDGENILDRIKREAACISASTQQSLAELVIQRILYGPEGSTAALTVGGQDGRTREITLKRSAAFSAALDKQRSGDAWKRLPGETGYIDLDRLNDDNVKSALESLHNLKSIIIDARGTAGDSAIRLAAALSTHSEPTPAALITTPLVLAPDLPQNGITSRSASSFYARSVSGHQGAGFSGRVVMLVDGRTAGPSEQAGLFLEAATKIEVIGSPSAGALGEPTNFFLPGQITVSFSGQDVRHANAGQVQRLGFQPSITVLPTITGVRNGRDEVLEKALAYLPSDTSATLDFTSLTAREQKCVSMAKVCEICGRGPQFGHRISHAHNVTKRRWNLNLQTVHAIVKGAGKRVRVCTSCIRSGKVQKAPLA